MGTSANLLVKWGDNTVIQHTSYDAHTSSVFAQIASTVAACGLQALRDALSTTKIIHETEVDEDNEASIQNDILKKSSAVYLSACAARSQPPFGLVSAVRYPYGAPDFAHGGVIPLLGGSLIHGEGWSPDPFDADFILDADAGTLTARLYETGQETASNSWVLDLNTVEGVAPSALLQVLDQADLDTDETLPSDRAAFFETLIQEAVSLAASGNQTDKEEREKAYAAARGVPSSLPLSGPGPNAPGHHTITVHANDRLLLLLVSDILQTHASDWPDFARPGTLRLSDPAVTSDIASLLVDWSTGFASEAVGGQYHTLMSNLADVLATSGVSYEHRTPNSFTRRHAGGGMTSVGGSFFDDDELEPMRVTEAWVDVSSLQKRQELFADALSKSDEASVSRVVCETILATARLDAPTLQKLWAANAPPLDESCASWCQHLLQNVAPAEDLLAPAARRDRLNTLTAEEQQKFFAILDPVSSALLQHDLGLIDLDENPPASASGRPSRPGL